MVDNAAMPTARARRIQDSVAELLAIGIVVWLSDAILLAARGRGEVDPLHVSFSIGVVAVACVIAAAGGRYVPGRPLLVVAAIALAWFARFGLATAPPLRVGAAVLITACCALMAWYLPTRTLVMLVPLALLGHQWLITRQHPGAGPIVAAVILTPLLPRLFEALRSRPGFVLAASAVAVVLAVAVVFPLRRRVDARTWVGRAAESPPASGSNIVLIVIDTLRADRLGAFGYRVRPASPFIDSLAGRSTVFPRAYSSSSWTMPAVASIFTGLPPGAHGVVTSDHAIRAEVPTLAETLRKAGYYTTGISANFGLDREHGYARGFARYTVLWRIIRGTWDAVPSIWDDLNTILTHYYDQWADLVPDWNWKPHADTVTSRAIAEIDSAPRDRPLFLFVQYVDPHAPCDAPGRDRWSPSPADRGFDEQWSVEYDREIRRLDSALQQLVGHIDQRLNPARTMLIIVADHGEQLGENGWRGHGLNLSEATIRVPMLVRYPAGLKPPTDPASPIATARLFDFAIEAANLEPRMQHSPPQSSLVRGNVMLRSVTDGTYKLVQSWDIRSGRMTHEELFRLPDERHDVRAAGSATAATLRAAMNAEPLPIGSPETLSDEGHAKFRALGYLH